ncbi:mRNA-capping enzyme subunit beta [Tieghemiomyces parasiticus]|uniref:mRNA-capping enzyme subunit beta n=1 Tax=Tieghemiomyces parasiticus TaxID=78921 RepID=A0A9W8A6F6_9FUNG|nr:mRNA-capping enzyme subunit beta [Tieghemiomyces parasiticus]
MSTSSADRTPATASVPAEPAAETGRAPKRIRSDSQDAESSKPRTTDHRPPALEPSLFNSAPIPDLVSAIGKFLFQHVNRPHVEIEAKLGQLIDNMTGQRLVLPATSMCIVNLEPTFAGGVGGGGGGPRSRYRFKSDMTLEQHRYFNQLLNRQTEVTQKPTYRGARVHYKHTREVDRFYVEPSGARVRVTYDQKTDEVVPGGVIEKHKIAHLDVYSPNTRMDFRITVSEEKPVPKPTVDASHERQKDRLSYKHQIWQVDLTQVKSTARRGAPTEDLTVTHELEIELADTDLFLRERSKFQTGQPNQYNTIVQTLLNNIHMLAARFR